MVVVTSNCGVVTVFRAFWSNFDNCSCGIDVEKWGHDSVLSEFVTDFPLSFLKNGRESLSFHDRFSEMVVESKLFPKTVVEAEASTTVFRNLIPHRVFDVISTTVFKKRSWKLRHGIYIL